MFIILFDLCLLHGLLCKNSKDYLATANGLSCEKFVAVQQIQVHFISLISCLLAPLSSCDPEIDRVPPPPHHEFQYS